MIFKKLLMLLCVIWCELKAKYAKQDLEFWSRDPSFDFRRSYFTTRSQLDSKKEANEMLERINSYLRYSNKAAPPIYTNLTFKFLRSRSKSKRKKRVLQKQNSRQHWNNINQHEHRQWPPVSHAEKHKERIHSEKVSPPMLPYKMSSKHSKSKPKNKFTPSPHIKPHWVGPNQIEEHKRPQLHHTYKHKDRTHSYKDLRSTRLPEEPNEETSLQNKDNEKNEEDNHHLDADDVDTSNLNVYFIRRQMEKLMTEFPEANATVEVLGRTVSYNDIVLLKITESNSEVAKHFRADDDKFVDEEPEKKIIFIVHGLSVMGSRYCCTMYELKEFIEDYVEYLDLFDIFLMPLANPDGFRMKTQIWNKNVSPQSECFGVALDRNFDVAWNESKSTNACNQQYPGEYPFSEAETRAVRTVFQRYSQKIIAYIHLHSGTYTPEVYKGDAVLYPRGYTDSLVEDDKYIDLRGEIDEEIKNATFRVYSVTVDSLYNWYGKVSGTSVDYASTVYGIPYAMEFVMQPYKEDPNPKSDDVSLKHVLLTEVWYRIIRVVFNSIYNSLHHDDNSSE